jgi:pimeloyl-ACP methyl ester carboxylesterase
MKEIGVTQADVFGYSMGGGIAWQLTIRRSDRMRGSGSSRVDAEVPSVGAPERG